MNSPRMLPWNLLWLASCLPKYYRFRRALGDPKSAQARALESLMRENRETAYGRRHGFSAITGWQAFQQLPLTRATDYEAPVREIMSGADHVLTAAPVDILQPTSGTSSSPKLIPYTATVANEFRNGLDPWIADLLLRHPRLLFRSQYWSISPATPTQRPPGSRVPVGFLDDMAYFGDSRRWIMRRVLALPAEVRQVQEIDANQYVTLLFLLRRGDLGLVSVWHPSFLTILVDVMRAQWDRCLADVRAGGIDAGVNLPRDLRAQLERALPPDEARYRELAALDVSRSDIGAQVWPRLELVSCWTDGQAASALPALGEAFPSAMVQPKGLLATEGVVTIPFGRDSHHVCAVNSHVIEFIDERGATRPAWDLQEGQTYEVVITTGGGLYRYRLGDRVKVNGRMAQTPCLQFLGRAGVVSDFAGEKVHLEHVEVILEELGNDFGLSERFMMLVPCTTGSRPCYTLLIEEVPGDALPGADLARRVEQCLCANYHYRHARQLHQLDPAVVERVAAGATARYRDFMAAQGTLAGSVKFPALCRTPGVQAFLAQNQEAPYA